MYGNIINIQAWSAVNTCSKGGYPVSLAFLICSCAVGGGVEMECHCAEPQCLGTNTAVEGTCEKAIVLSVNEEGCAFPVLQAGKLSFTSLAQLNRGQRENRNTFLNDINDS